MNFVGKIVMVKIGLQVLNIKVIVDAVGLLPRADDKFQSYSLGMKQRLVIAAALLGDPELLILDEPTKGLDPAGTKEIRDLVVRLGREGKTIFISSHLLHEVEQVCDHVAIIKEGRLIAQGVMSDLLKHKGVLELRVTDPDKAMELLRRESWISSLVRDGELLLVGVGVLP